MITQGPNVGSNSLRLSNTLDVFQEDKYSSIE